MQCFVTGWFRCKCPLVVLRLTNKYELYLTTRPCRPSQSSSLFQPIATRCYNPIPYCLRRWQRCVVTSGSDSLFTNWIRSYNLVLTLLQFGFDARKILLFDVLVSFSSEPIPSVRSSLSWFAFAFVGFLLVCRRRFLSCVLPASLLISSCCYSFSLVMWFWFDVVLMVAGYTAIGMIALSLLLDLRIDL